MHDWYIRMYKRRARLRWLRTLAIQGEANGISILSVASITRTGKRKKIIFSVIRLRHISLSKYAS